LKNRFQAFAFKWVNLYRYASDGVFRVGQRAALSLAGDENIENYRPLINDVLIRVRTELCILESFGREVGLYTLNAAGP
jgi:hypothetical protein